MKREEYDPWFEEHYAELRGQAVRFRAGQDDAEDLLHDTYLSIIESSMFEVMPMALAWPWTVSQMRGLTSNLVVADERQRAALEKFLEDDPFAASITDRGKRYKANPVKTLNGEPLGPHWFRWVGSCPKCGGPASLEVVTDWQAPKASASETDIEALARKWSVVTSQKVAFCINGHRADYKRGQRPRDGA